MKRTLKIVVIVFGVLVGLLVVAGIAITMLVDPNDYKDDITRAVKDATGRELTIDGKLKLSVFPWLGLETGKLALSNAPGFGNDPFARMDSAGIRVALLPLLTGSIEVGTLRLNGLVLNLAKAPSGRTNWDDLLESKPGKPAKEAPKAAKPAPSAKAAPVAVAIGGIDIRKANLHWNDQASSERAALRDFNLKTGRVALGQPVKLHLDVELEQSKPARRVPVSLDTVVTVTDKDLALKNTDLRIDDSRLTGSVSLAFNQPVYRFDLKLDQIDVDRYLPPAEAKPAAAPAKSGAGQAAEPVAIPLSLLRALNTKGELAIGKLKAMGIRSEDIVIKVNAKDGLITLGPNSAKLYKGKYAGNTMLDVRGKEPRFHFKESLAGIDVGPFLRDAQLFANFNGTGNIDLDLTGQGFDADAIKHTLNGQTKIDFRKGEIVGIDIVGSLNAAKAKFDELRGKPARTKPKANEVTAYDSLTASIATANGVANNSDLKLEAPALRATGKGTANLVSEKLDYKLTNFLLKDPKYAKYGIVVHAHGPFTDLSFDIGLQDAVKDATKVKAKESFKKQKEKLLEKYRLK